MTKDRLTWGLSVALHLCLFFFFLLATMQHIDEDNNIKGGPFFSIDAASMGTPQSGKTTPPPEPGEDSPNQQPHSEAQVGVNSGGGNLWGTGDSASLGNSYTESTLGVHMRYPNGWSYLDQKVKKQLDGITFLGPATSNGQIPYIHMKVQDKYLFNPGRYKQSVDMGKSKAYYNEPEILEEQYTFEVYVRTENDQDYLFKLIVKGEPAFHEFKPVFLAMLQTFSFRGN
ncbi:MAG: hypothetical protein LWX56_10190 [Ignavibacteria bacterium]|nr:hypothetical protein [Ignavibacteria bacterium]